MHLNVNDDRQYERPTLADFQRELASLPVDEFAILAAAEQFYIQTYHNADGTYALEYREGSADDHYEAVETIDDPGDLIRAFALYYAGDPVWKSIWTWERLELE